MRAPALGVGASLFAAEVGWAVDAVLIRERYRRSLTPEPGGNAVTLPGCVPRAALQAQGAALTIDGLAGGYRGRQVLHDVSLVVPDRQLCAFVGPSGCGKTTLLRLIAGFDRPLAGSIWIGGAAVAGPLGHLPPERRGVGMVFQDHALFPHLDVAANVTFGLHGRRAAVRRQRLDEVLGIVALQGMGHRHPHELSGGQQQRVALARALAPAPAILLLDEPFASLDERMRSGLAAELRRVLVQAGTTAVLVTHDIHEAFAFADRVGVLWEGRLVQWGTPQDIYQRPATRRVARFVGRGAFVRARVIDGRRLETDLGVIEADAPSGYPVGTRLELFLRARDLAPGGPSDVAATVRAARFQGASMLYTLATDTVDGLLCRFPPHVRHGPGEQVRIRLAVRDPVCFRV